MKLYIEDGEDRPGVLWQADVDPAPDDFTLAQDPINWEHHRRQYPESYMTYRNALISHFEPGWSSFTDDEKRSLMREAVWPSETPGAELDDLYTASNRRRIKREVMDRLRKVANVLPMKSYQSNKYFNIKVDDLGVVSSAEITTDTPI